MKKILLLSILFIVGCANSIDPEQDKYCTQNDDCNTGQSCIEGKCENFIEDN